MNNTSVIINNMKINERSDGRLEGRITVNGKRKSFYGKTKSEIKNKAKEYLNKIDNGYKDPKRIMLNEYIEYWLETYKKNKIEPSSYSRLFKTYKNQIHDTIGAKYIGNVTTKDIQNLIDSYAHPKNSSIKPLAKSGLKKITHLLNPCLNKAVEEGVIGVNPCKNVIIPTDSCILKETKEQFSLNDYELEKLRKCALSQYKTTHEYISRECLIILIMVNTGLRVGEILALEWKDVDLKNKILSINKTIQSSVASVENGEIINYSDYLKKSTKTKSGKRILPINDITIHYFNELKEYDKRHSIISPYVTSTRNGTRNSARNLQRSLYRLVKRANINPDTSLHTLRHTFGSTLLRKKVPIEIVSSLMGHANITITYNKYIHVIKEEKAKAMTMIEVC